MATDNKQEIRKKLEDAAKKYNVPPELVLALANQESGFNQGAKSKAGAIGVMQLMPATAKELGVDPNNIDQNIDGGVRYLAQMLELNNGNIPLALASYNAGYGAVRKHNGIPPYAETQNYVKNIMANIDSTNANPIVATANPVQVPQVDPLAVLEADSAATKAIDDIKALNKLSKENLYNIYQSSRPSFENMTDAQLQMMNMSFRPDMDKVQDLQNQMNQSVMDAYAAGVQADMNMSNRLAEKYKAMRDNIATDPRLQQGSYYIPADYYANLAPLEMAARGQQPSLQDYQNIERARYQMNLANQYGVPYEDMMAAQLNRIQQQNAVTAKEIETLVARAAAGDTRAVNLLSTMKEIAPKSLEAYTGGLEQNRQYYQAIAQELFKTDAALGQEYLKAVSAGDINLANNIAQQGKAIQEGKASIINTQLQTGTQQNIANIQDARKAEENLIKQQEVDIKKQLAPTEAFKNTSTGMLNLGIVNPTSSTPSIIQTLPSNVQGTIVNPELPAEDVNTLYGMQTTKPTSSQGLFDAFKTNTSLQSLLNNVQR